VQSGALASVGYDAEARALEIEFRSGRVYRYEEVPPSVHDWLLRAPNKGVFVTRQIVGRYPERSLPDARPPARPAAIGSVAVGDPVFDLDLDLEGVLRASLVRLGAAKDTPGE
jgi:hypothetical protein